MWHSYHLAGTFTIFFFIISFSDRSFLLENNIFTSHNLYDSIFKLRMSCRKTFYNNLNPIFF